MGTLQPRNEFTPPFIGTANIYEGNTKIPLFIAAENITYYESIVQTSSKEEAEFLTNIYRKRCSVVHPCLISVNYVTPLNDLCFSGIRMYIEYVPASLREELEIRGKAQPFTQKEVVELIKDVTQAVKTLEEQHILWSWLGLEHIRRKGERWKIQDCRYNQMEVVGDLGINLKQILRKVCEDEQKYPQKLRDLLRRVEYYTPEQIFSIAKDWNTVHNLPAIIQSTPAIQTGSIIARKHSP